VKAIVVGYNESEPSERALQRGVELARLYGARLVVTSVVPVLVPAHAVGELERSGLADKLAARGIEAEVVEGAGDPAEVICTVAEQQGADLIVVGTREPSLIERQLGHSVSEHVQRRAHCDVLIVH